MFWAASSLIYPGVNGCLGVFDRHTPLTSHLVALSAASLATCKASTSHLNTLSYPAIPPALLCQLLVHCTFLLLGFIHMLLPRYSELWHHHLFGGIGEDTMFRVVGAVCSGKCSCLTRSILSFVHAPSPLGPTILPLPSLSHSLL